MDNRPISEQYHEAALEWVDAESAATLLEDTKSAVMSQKMLALGDIAVNKAELIVKGRADWHDYLVKINTARTNANRLKVEVEYMRMRFQEWISADANERVQARI